MNFQHATPQDRLPDELDPRNQQVCVRLEQNNFGNSSTKANWSYHRRTAGMWGARPCQNRSLRSKVKSSGCGRCSRLLEFGVRFHCIISATNWTLGVLD